MNVFRFCRWSLAALPVFFVFTACNHWTGFPTEAGKGSGIDIPVTIRAVSIAEGAQNETITRASGQEKSVQEPVTRSFGGMLAKVNIEEDLSALRDGGNHLGNNVKFRVFALETSGEDKVLYSYGDYEIKNSAVNPINNTNLHVQLNKTYDFVCISYNNTTLPDDEENYEEGEELPLLSASTSKEILYWREEAKKITGDFTLEILLRPQFVKVKLKFDWNSTYNTGWYISEIAAGSPALQGSGTSGDFNLATGLFSSVSSDAAFTGWTSSGAGTSTVWESTLTFIPSATVDSLKFSREVIKVSTNGLATDPYLIPTPPAGTQQALALGTAVEQGKSYTINIEFRLPKFASSNIYWDGSKLTFKPYSDTPGSTYATEQQYQGVHVKFGSLVGVSPAVTYTGTGYWTYFYAVDMYDDAIATPIYVPDYNSTNPTATTWMKTTAGTQFGGTGSGGTAWAYVPYLSPAPNLTDNPDDRSVIDYPETNWKAEYKGDICQLISKTQNLGDYRLPMPSEFGAAAGGSNVPWSTTAAISGWIREEGSSTTSWDQIFITNSVDNDAGRYAIDNGGRFGPTKNFFPASGYRSDVGLQMLAPNRVWYWSGGASSSTIGYCLYFLQSGIRTDFHTSVSAFSRGHFVRCILDD